MVNTERIVPIQKIDYLSMVGTVLKIANVSTGVIAPVTVDGDFEVTGSGSVGNKLANQPLKSCDFKSGVTAGVVYFCADYAYEGFKVAGTAVTTSGADVVPDGVTLYTATLSDSAVTIAAITPSLS